MCTSCLLYHLSPEFTFCHGIYSIPLPLVVTVKNQTKLSVRRSAHGDLDDLADLYTAVVLTPERPGRKAAGSDADHVVWCFSPAHVQGKIHV